MTLHRRCLFSVLFILTALTAFLSATTPQDSTASSGWIVIPVTEYQSLRSLAYPAEPAPEAPPVQATVTRLSYDLRIQGELAVGQANLTVDVIKEGWVRIPIPSTILLVQGAKLDGKPLSLVAGDRASGTKYAVFSHKGRALLQLDIVLPVTTEAASESIVLPPAIAGITQAAVQLPRQGVDVKLTGGFLAEKSATATESKWVAYGRGSEPLVFSWWKKTEDHRSSQPLRLRGSLTELIGLGEDSTSIQAEINAEILQGIAQEMKIKVPDKITINQVAGAMVADWEVKPGELSIKFLEPIDKSARFLIAGETGLPRDGQVEIPLFRLLDAERETGGVAVEVLGAGEITDRKSLGLESADATDLGAIVSSRQSPSLIAFRFRSGDAKAERSLSVTVARYTQESVLMAIIEEARYQVLMSEEGKTLIQASYAIRNNRKNFLKVTLPKDAVVWSATLSNKPIRPGEAPDGSLLLPLEKARTGEEAPAFAAEIQYFVHETKWDKNGKLQLKLPALDLPVSRTGLKYFYPPLFKVTPEPGAFRIQNYENPSSAVLNKTFGSGGGYGYATESGIASNALKQSLPLVSNNVLDLINIQAGVVKAEDPIFGKEKADQSTQTLVNQYRVQSQGGKRAGILPIQLSFPEFGPSIFLVSELTAENQSPAIDISYEESKKGGAR